LKDCHSNGTKVFIRKGQFSATCPDSRSSWEWRWPSRLRAQPQPGPSRGVIGDCVRRPRVEQQPLCPDRSCCPCSAGSVRFEREPRRTGAERRSQMTRIAKFNRYFYALVLMAIVGGISLFVPEALALQAVALDSWFPTGYVGDVLAWALLFVDICIIGFIGYRLGFKRYVQPPDGET
jgi:hypothetical protein